MAVEYPAWSTLKSNIVSILEVIAAEETLEDSDRDFTVGKDRYRPWIEPDQTKPLVNVMVQGVGQDSATSASRTNSTDEITVNVDMYAIGIAGEALPVDEVAANRIDLLIAQVREGLTRLGQINFGFDTGKLYTNLNYTLTYYDQENQESAGQYAPARWSFTVKTPFTPADNNTYIDLEELNVDISDDLAELYSLQFKYDGSD